MIYITKEFFTFFNGLQKNNTTEWFNDNRKAYEQHVKKPFSLLIDEMIRRISKHEPDVKITASDAIMRINKDIRFSKDKTPYNTHVSANISKYGKKNKAYPGFYLQLVRSSSTCIIILLVQILDTDTLLQRRTKLFAVYLYIPGMEI